MAPLLDFGSDRLQHSTDKRCSRCAQGYAWYAAQRQRSVQRKEDADGAYGVRISAISRCSERSERSSPRWDTRATRVSPCAEITRTPGRSRLWRPARRPYGADVGRAWAAERQLDYLPRGGMTSARDWNRHAHARKFLGATGATSRMEQRDPARSPSRANGSLSRGWSKRSKLKTPAPKSGRGSPVGHRAEAMSLLTVRPSRSGNTQCRAG